MEKKPGFVFAHKQRILSLQTTHTPTFLGLHHNVGLCKHSNNGKGVVIELIDSGISPHHPLFSHVGIPTSPAKRKGVCEFNFTTKCNNKLIGARSFLLANASPVDDIGHGTHTTSTAAGAFTNSV
ncbi:hypothetical protein FXO38_10508 [Capsicum annuum]|uniref:Peptidase S8/S53 domain-containing protein n=1 Tax=Capsicum annuum TaxID=4072 RepID=A0A2G3AEF2_CAPAN|nr:hypothetical protein FXO38_10508 [Capsicum annuum]KAF3666649.1 hypothetical protein FXO37_10418 [Capsicum annuum]PHT92617.1 hypothetical protein T459_00499 [Capsicum annuum]